MTAAPSHEVWVFFYGSYLNFNVLQEVGMAPRLREVAAAPGFDIRIAPRANLVRSDRQTAWGINATATHDELTRLYVDHAQGVLGQTYRPEAILTRRADGLVRPVLTYLCADMVPAPAEPAYVDRIVRPARALGLPSWYVSRIAESAQ